MQTRIPLPRLPRRILLAGALTLLATACGQSGPPAPTPGVGPTPTASPSPTPPAPLVGRIARADLQRHPGWEQLDAADYAPNPADLNAIRVTAPAVQVLAFVGTWCRDSQREVPRLLKLLDQTNWGESRLTLYGLDRSLRDAEGIVERYDARDVPTFIFSREGREIGRIVKQPRGTLEGDVAAILTGRPIHAPAAPLRR